MKTAMQELIEYVEEMYSKDDILEVIVNKANKLLKKEKKQILKAWYDSDMIITGDEGVNYYHNTYNQSK